MQVTQTVTSMSYFYFDTQYYTATQSTEHISKPEASSTRTADTDVQRDGGWTQPDPKHNQNLKSYYNSYCPRYM